MKTRRDVAFGVIVLKEGKTLLVKHQKGHWAFPKGHVDGEETPHETARRELKEETGLIVTRFLAHEPLSEHYHFEEGGVQINKQVTYFFAEVEGEVVRQHAEIADFCWVTFTQGAELATFPEMKALCHAAGNLSA